MIYEEASAYLNSVPPPGKTSRIPWTLIRKMLNNALARTTYVIAVVGYVILFSDRIESFLSAHVVSLPPVILSWKQRAYFTYYGSVALIASYLLYLLRAPREIKDHGTRHSYVSAATTPIDLAECMRVNVAINAVLREMDLSKVKDPVNVQYFRTILDGTNRRNTNNRFEPNEFTQTVPQLLTFFYNMRNFNRPATRVCCFILALLGYLGVVIPSLEVFAKVVWSSF